MPTLEYGREIADNLDTYKIMHGEDHIYNDKNFTRSTYGSTRAIKKKNKKKKKQKKNNNKQQRCIRTVVALACSVSGQSTPGITFHKKCLS